MNDQRVETRSALRVENPRHGKIRCGVAAKAIDRFGGKGDKLARAQQAVRERRFRRGELPARLLQPAEVIERDGGEGEGEGVTTDT